MTVSHWRYNPSPDTLTADVVVVGAGICGVSAALAFERRGLRVRVLERGTVASGASSRNAGFLMRGAADHYVDAVRLYGREGARHLWKWTEDNLADLRREGIGELPAYRAVPSALLALDERQAEQLRRSAELMREDGFDAPWVTSGEDSVWRHGRPLGALLNPHDATINPIHMVRFLAAKLKTTTIHEHEPVLSITPDSAGSHDPSTPQSHFTLRTPSLTISTPRVLICSNAYAPLLIPSLAGVVTPRRGQMLAVANTPDGATGERPIELACSYYANHGSEYFRQTADGSVVIGGCRTYFADREVGYDDATTPWVQEALEAFAAKMLGPAWSATGITARWSGVMGFSPDGLPLVGPLPEFGGGGGGHGGREGGGVWFCGAFTGHGMSMGFRTAQAAAAAMLDGAEPPFPLSRVLAAKE